MRTLFMLHEPRAIVTPAHRGELCRHTIKVLDGCWTFRGARPCGSRIARGVIGRRPPWRRADVWLNPPFDLSLIGLFIERMVGHGRGIALVHVRTETEWFRPIWRHASALRFLAGRYVFHNPDGSRCAIENPNAKHFGKVANSGAPIVLASFGRHDADVLCLCGIDGHFVPLRIAPSILARALDASWRAIVVEWLRTQREPVRVADLYEAFTAHPKARRNRNWRAKLRQTLQRGAGRRVARNQWVEA